MNQSASPVICTFESRRADEMKSLIERFQATPVLAPSMQEVPVDQNETACAAIKKIIDGDVSYMILLTGVGTEAMLQVAASQNIEDDLIAAMKRIPQWVRGPKPAAVLSRLGIKYAIKAPEPNTWKELIAAIDNSDFTLTNAVVAVQEYGVANPELNAALQNRGASVVAVPVYRWALPDDVGPLQEAIKLTIANKIDVLMFTSAQQARHVLQVADTLNATGDWLTAANKAVVASIGPTCSETLRAIGLDVHVEASPPKMGPLVRAAVEHFRKL